MKIRYNKSASTATRYLGNNRSALAKSLEKLASGYTINRAADDAAGLAISEKMRRQITGLDRAYKNSKEGAMLIQTGEGALDEIHDMLNRAASLANQSANGTYDDEIDRQALQAELDQLCADIDRIAESANFNGIKLFQDRGLEFEGESGYGTAVEKPARQAAAAENAGSAAAGSAQSSSAPRTLDDLLEGRETGSLNIVYIEQSNALVTTTPATTGEEKNTLDKDKDITITNADGSTTTKKLSEILKTEIVPNTVKQVLDNYPAFGYLTGSTIGIGLEYYTKASNTGMENALAYVKIGYSKTADLDYAKYTLGVNVDTLPDTLTREDLVELEATIAHEMIHAFMDEATTAGMIGFDPTNNSFSDAVKFPTWFVEGMAQTASGPGNWVKINSGGGLQIDADSTATAIRSQISNHKLGSSKGGSADYGTGYLACMYLGWAITAGGDASTPVTAENISMGLTSLMNEVIGGKSLDKAIKELTNGKFTSTSDFQTKFNTAGNEITGFVHNLMVAKGDGRGGLVSGDLTATDLVPDTEDNSGTKLFELDTTLDAVKNVYPSGYPVLSGGTVSGDNTRVPGDFKPAVTEAAYGDFIIKGNLPSDGSGGMQGITWDDATKTLTVETGNNIEITMKSPTTGINGSLVLKGDGDVTLDGVKADGLTVSKDTQITYKGKNDIGAVTVDSGKNAVFQGEGQLKAGTFTNGGTAGFGGGAVIVGDGTGTIGGAVTIDKASVAADITSPKGPDGTELKSIAVDRSKLPSGFDIASVTVDGKTINAPLGTDDPGKLWLDPAESHRITFTDSSGVSKTLAAKLNTATNQLEWAEPAKPFTVTGGTEGTDYHYEDDGKTLVIDTDAVTSITGGSVKDEAGADLFGRIKIKDGIGAVDLELNSVQIDATKAGGNAAGILLGNGNNVKLTMKGENTIIGSGESAGIQFFGNYKRGGTAAELQESELHIEMTSGSKLTAKGGTVSYMGGAGIGAAWATDSSKSSIKITGEGTLDVTGGMGGAGIGGSEGGDVGDITIEGSGSGLKIKSLGGDHGAGIGAGGWVSNYSDPKDQTAGNITITGNVDIDASSKSHGTGIGSACHSGVGDITIGQDPATGSNDDIKIYAKGGNDGAAIGSGWAGTMGTVTIWGGTIDAEAGSNGAGIGSGMDAKTTKNADGTAAGGDIIIKGGTITAKGETSASGIGSGVNGNVNSITIEGGVITAKGGWTHDGGNIGGYDLDGNEIKITLTDPEKATIKAGPGEGLYVTTGTFDKDGNQLYALDMKYLSELLAKDKISSDPPGSTGLTFPVDIKATLKNADGTEYNWTDLQHGNVKKGTTSAVDVDPENDAYIWMRGHDVKLEVTYAGDGGPYKVEVELKFFEDYGLWRYEEEDLPPEKPQKPEQQRPTTPTPPTPSTNPTQSATSEKKGQGGIILQIGAEYGETLTVPRFYLSLDALKMGNLDISTQPNAWESMPVIKDAINRVSSIRTTYGALFNRLEHNQNQLQQEVESITDAESRIRDTDVAEEMMRYVKSNIMVQSAQAMLAQANQIPQNALQLLS